MITDKTIPVNTAIIEDNRFIREGIEMILNSNVDFKISGSYPSCEDALECKDLSKAQIILIDIKLPGISGIEGIKLIRKKYPEIFCIIFTAYEDDDNILDAIAAGAVGFISKKTQPKDLMSLLRSVLNGGSPATPNVARKIITSFEKQKIGQQKFRENLTANEIQILEKISNGKSYTTAANELSLSNEEILISIRTVYTKLRNMQFL